MTRTGQPHAVHQVLATLAYGDAIGNEVLGIQRVLRQAGFESDIFVETADPKVEHLTRDYRELVGISSPDNLLIHHFSIGSRASRVAFALPERMMLVYHNITPPEYFAGIHERLVRFCFMGRREISAYVPRCDLALGASEFSRRELAAIGFTETGVLPPVVPGLAHLDGPSDPLVASDFDDAWTNLLFVGRVIPNKRIENVIRYYEAYRRVYNPRTRLLLVGSYREFEQYLALLHHFIATLKVPDVYLVGHVSNAELSAYYDVADLFLCASEHEGFCVPLIEAFYKRIPVVAYARTAVPDTLDGGGVLFDTQRPDEVAALIDAVLSNAGLQERILEAQDAAFLRLAARDFGGTLLKHVQRVLQAPRREAPRLAPDFWQQFEAVERLEELQIGRPSAFKAVSRVRSPLSTEGGDAPGWQGAKSENIANMRTMSDAASRDAAPAECQRTSDSGHKAR